MITTREILKEEIEALKEELIKRYDEKGMRASGRWADSLEVTVSENSGKLEGLEYTQQLESGRKAGGFPPIDQICLLYTSPSPRDLSTSRMPSSA